MKNGKIRKKMREGTLRWLGKRNSKGREMKTKRTQLPGQQWRIDPPKLALMRRNARAAFGPIEQRVNLSFTSFVS